jgi:hypothetical protein
MGVFNIRSVAIRFARFVDAVRNLINSIEPADIVGWTLIVSTACNGSAWKSWRFPSESCACSYGGYSECDNGDGSNFSHVSLLTMVFSVVEAKEVPREHLQLDLEVHFGNEDR